MYGDLSAIERREKMKRKLLSVVLYATTSFALAVYWEALYGAGPIKTSVLMYLAISGTVLFAVSCVMLLISSQVGLSCAITAGLLSWPYFVIHVPTIPWSRLLSAVSNNSRWLFLLIAILALVVTSIYSLNQLRCFVRGNGIEGRNTGLKLVVALIYAGGVFIVENWRGILEWLLRLRYGN
jgi:hypothetical protein